MRPATIVGGHASEAEGESCPLPERFVLVSNRLPYDVAQRDGRIVLHRAIGGLVTALDPLLRRTGGTWIGWTGKDAEVPDRVPVDAERSYELRPLALSPDEVERFYHGYSNGALWPLFHYFQEHCGFHRENWQAYRAVNRRFAEAAAAVYRPGDFIWIHDYHLLLAPGLVRKLVPEADIGFFLHTPFPPSELFSIEPHAAELVEGMLGADLVGFHTDAYAGNFVDAVRDLTAHELRGQDLRLAADPPRTVRVGRFPISIDFAHFDALARRPEALEKAREIRQRYRADIIALGVDRLDYTKGILERLQGIELLLERHPELRGSFTFVQFSAPSRTGVATYEDMRAKIERVVGRINGRFGRGGSIPIDYRYQTHTQRNLVPYFLAADLALITPLRDGMNLVAKEYVASRHDESGVLVLSRFAGAAGELEQALLVNPYDPERLADEIHRGIHMSAEEKRRRMRALREVVRRNDVYRWLERFVRAARLGRPVAAR